MTSLPIVITIVVASIAVVVDGQPGVFDVSTTPSAVTVSGLTDKQINRDRQT